MTLAAGLGSRAAGTLGLARRWWVPAILVVIVICAGVARGLPSWATVFPAAGGVRLLGGDAYYHLRHARFAAENFPSLLRWDPGTFYPDGQVSDAAGLFDLAIATVALAAGGGHADQHVIAVTAALTPVVLGLLTFVLLYQIAAAVLGRAPALVACLFYLLHPGPSLSRTELGFADHHAAELVLSLWTVAALVRYLARARAGTPKSRTPWWRPAFWAPLPLAVFVFTWKGAPAHILITGLALFLYAALEVARGRDARELATALARYGVGLTLMIAGVVIARPEWVLVRNLMPAIVAAAAVLAVAPAALAITGAALRRRGCSARAAAVTGLAAAALAGAAAALAYPDTPWLVEQLLARKTPGVMEHQAVTAAAFWRAYGVVGVAAAMAVPLALFLVIKKRLAGEAIFPLLTAVLVTLWWAWARDYDYLPAPYLAFLAALLIANVDKSLARWAGPGLRRAARGAFALAVLLPVAPFQTGVRSPWPDHSRQAAPPTIVNDGWVEAMTWLRTRTPVPSITPYTRVPAWPEGGFQYPPDSYGVLSAWDFGNLISGLGERPAVRSGWPSGRLALWFVSDNENKAFSSLCEACTGAERVRYVVIDGRTMGPHFIAKLKVAKVRTRPYSQADGLWLLDGQPVPHWTFGPAYERTMGVALYARDGDGLGHFRLVYDSPHQSFLYYSQEPDGLYRRWKPIDTLEQKTRFRANVRRNGAWRTEHGVAYDGVIRPTVKIFEAVPGARLFGTAAPYAWVRVELELKSATTGRVIDYRQTVVADGDGRFEMTVPYATVGSPDASVIEVRGAYRLSVSARADGRFVRAGPVLVFEDAVRDGAAVPVGAIP